MLDKGCLHRMQVAWPSNTFDGGDHFAFVSRRKAQARIHAPAIHMDRARATLAVVAALLGAGEADMVAHAIEQGGAWIDIQFMERAIDVQLHMNVFILHGHDAGWCTVLACVVGIRKSESMKLPGAHCDTCRTDAC